MLFLNEKQTKKKHNSFSIILKQKAPTNHKVLYHWGNEASISYVFTDSAARRNYVTTNLY